MAIFTFVILFSCFPVAVFASTEAVNYVSYTNHWLGWSVLSIFMFAYVLVIMEDTIKLRKSKPMLIAAGLIWGLIAFVLYLRGQSHLAAPAIRSVFLEYAELFFFLLVAMTYVNAMIERNVFDTLRDWLINKHLSYRQLFWITGCITFILSPIADNLTTALIMCAVIMAVGGNQKHFVGVCCVNIVVAANAGGAFSPFGDITTLMVWQKGHIEFLTFLNLFIPSLVSFIVPALLLSFNISKAKPLPINQGITPIKYGGKRIVCLFLLTIITAICFHHFLYLPPIFGMMFGLGFLKLFSFYIHRTTKTDLKYSNVPTDHEIEDDFDIFDKIASSEWDTLFFFYGVILAVGGLGFIGYLEGVSNYLYGDLGNTSANIIVGLLSAIVDNIPVMFAVLTMDPIMNEFQWLLVTFTTGIGGSLLSIGSASGVALMGQSNGNYTFISHLKWLPVILIGYVSGVLCHFLINF